VPRCDVIALLRDLARRYPPGLVDDQLRDVPRIAFHIQLVLANTPSNGSVCDIGGGLGLFSVACAALGMRTVLVDDFADEVNDRYGDSPLDLHRAYGVELVRANVLESPPLFSRGSLDAVTSFDAIEHFHHSPRPLLHSMLAALPSHGLLLISTPNSVNLRKRLASLAGKTKWSDFDSWYNRDLFRGHVREPDVEDLLRIALDLGLVGSRIIGRNWLGHHSNVASIRIATRVFDRVLQMRPALCSNIYLLGRRP
jgi:SAM-dependent methyltransferase